MERIPRSCPDKVDGIPAVCTWVEGWQKKMSEFIEKRQNFILLGEEEYLKQVKEAYEKRNWKKFVKIILLGSGTGAVALPGITSASLTTALGLGMFSAIDPEPISKVIILVIIGAILGATAATIIWTTIALYKDDNAKLKLVEVNLLKNLVGMKVEFENPLKE